ncbi:MAG: PASTA domain-containing protein [Bacteroides sp.]|nr:PASTA domain-containing protein [Bacteroides sp.]
MKKETNLCMSCMGRLNDHGTCPLCGYFDAESYISSYLAPKTFLADRYIAGKLIGYCGESALYIGFDTEAGRKVTIREYMPDTLCVRERDDEIVSVRSDKLPLYKTYLAEFIELHSTLMRSSNIRCIQPVLDVFTQNNTAYAVMEYIGGISLKAYLTNCGEVMTWEQIKELFPPVLTALSMLHGLGIVHRGISPSTIFVSERNELRLIGFSISAAHTADSDIGYEVFGGFAAPEQYSSARRNGSWTDVYGISAVLYRCLTGITPPSATDRLINDTLTDPMLINRNIPKNVSDVIMRGMRLEAEERISTVTEFVDRLFEQPVPAEEYSSEISIPTPKPAPKKSSGNTAPPRSAARGGSGRSDPPPVRKRRGKRKTDRDKIKFIAISAILGIIILAFIIAMIVTASAGPEEKEPEITTARTTASPPSAVTTAAETSADEAANATHGGYVLPNFEGTFFTTVSTNSQYSYLIFNASYDFSSEFKSGQIISQSIPPETVVQAGTEISVLVSKGPEKLPLPDYTGKTVEAYVKELSDLGIKYRIEDEITDEVEEGMVAGCSKEIGEDIYVADSEEVVIYSAVKPEETTTSFNALEFETEPELTDAPENTENTEYSEPDLGDMTDDPENTDDYAEDPFIW